MKELYRKAASSAIDALPEWQSNRDLSFIDFDLLGKDLSRIGLTASGRDAEVLFMTLVFIKAMHSFSLEFRRSICS